MKERTDKLDAITLASSLTGFHVDVIEGVIGSEISIKSLPAKGVPKVRFFLFIKGKADWYAEGRVV